MERYVGCMLCGVGKADTKFETCAAEAKSAGVELAEGFEDHTHIWTEMISMPEGWYGKGLLDLIK